MNTHNASEQRQHIPLIRWPVVMPETQEHSSQGIANTLAVMGRALVFVANGSGFRFWLCHLLILDVEQTT